jgi:hypothetical protein
MGKYKRIVVPALVLGAFIALAIPLSVYILSLPFSQIASNGCSDFSDYQLANCMAFYQRQGDVEALQAAAQTALGILWVGLFLGGIGSFFVFPRFSLSRTRKAVILFLGLLGALLLAGLPLILSLEMVTNGYIFALSLLIGFLAFALTMATPTEEGGVTEEPATSRQGQEQLEV